MARIIMLLIALYALYLSAGSVFLALQSHSGFQFNLVFVLTAFVAGASGLKIMSRLARSAT